MNFIAWPSFHSKWVSICLFSTFPNSMCELFLQHFLGFVVTSSFKEELCIFRVFERHLQMLDPQGHKGSWAV